MWSPTDPQPCGRGPTHNHVVADRPITMWSPTDASPTRCQKGPSPRGGRAARTSRWRRGGITTCMPPTCHSRLQRRPL
eukprot:7377812-Prymnesium_polylepis.1